MDELIEVIVKHVYSSDITRQVGGDGQVRVDTYVDLMSASHVERHLVVMADAMVAVLQPILSGIQNSVIGGPKRGNPILIHEIGRTLGVPTAFAKHSEQFGRWIEGPIHNGANVVVVDDVSSANEILLSAVQTFRNSGHKVVAVCVLVERKEGDARRKLGEKGIELHSILELNDDDIGQLLIRHRRE